MLNALEDLGPLLGSAQTAATAERLRRRLGGAPRVEGSGSRLRWAYAAAGVDALFAAGRLVRFLLHPQDESVRGAFTGCLADGLPAGASRRALHEAFGSPVKAIAPQAVDWDHCRNEPVLAAGPWLDIFVSSGVKVVVAYSSALHPWAVRPRAVALLPASARGRSVCSFFCASCGRRAETVSLSRSRAPLPVVRVGFGQNTVGLDAPSADRVEALLLLEDPAALYSFRPFYAASFCPDCGACYCRQHWLDRSSGPPAWGDAWSYDWVESGRCPEGHRRELVKE